MTDEELKLAMAELQEVVRCRCDEAYRDRGLKDPHCECDSAEAVKVVAIRIKALTAKLAKTAKVALAYEDWVTDAYDLLEERREEFDPESPSDKAIMDLMDKAEAGIARATLAEIKGGNDAKSDL